MVVDEVTRILGGLGGRTFIQFCVGSGVHLGLDGAPEYTITIECPVAMTESGGPIEPTSTEALGRLRDLLMKDVVAVDHDHGALLVSFAEGHSLVVAPHDQYEAWQVNGDDGSLVVCMPGGELSCWAPK